jgi:hypothetical protein
MQKPEWEKNLHKTLLSDKGLAPKICRSIPPVVEKTNVNAYKMFLERRGILWCFAGNMSSVHIQQNIFNL